MDRVVYFVYRALSACVCALPVKVVWWTGWMAGAIGYVLGGSYRRLALRNLSIAFPELSDGERRAIARQHFRSLGANVLAGPKLASLSREFLREVVRVSGQEEVEGHAGEGKGIVMVISHIGNWELLSQMFPVLFNRLLGTIYQRLGNPYIDADVRAGRARLGVELFERKEGFQGAIRNLRAGGVVGVLIDQHAGDAGVWCPFFGRLASTSSLAAMLALRTGARLMPAAVFSDGPGRWHLRIEKPVEVINRDTDVMTGRLNEVLEGQIRQQPHDWFWVHNRWKTPRPKFLLATYKRGIIGSPTKPFRILIRSTNWLGDAVMTIPAVRAIKLGRPDAHVTIVTPAKLADLWKTVAEVDDVIPFESGEGIFAVARKLRRDFDAAVVLPNSVRTALEVWLAGIPRRVGYPGHRRGWFLNQVLRPKKSKKTKPSEPKHQVYHYLALAEFIGAEVEKNELGAPARSFTPQDRPVIGLVPGAEYGPAKRWLPERYAEVVQRLHESHQVDWRIFGVNKDREIVDEIVSRVKAPCEDRVGKTTLAGLIAELRQCDLVLTNDTGTMHLAASLAVPVVAIFGSTDPELTGPLGEGHTILRKRVECSPCFLRECPIDFPCMKTIETDEVVRAVEHLLQRQRNSQPDIARLND